MRVTPIFRDRHHAGRVLGERLLPIAGESHPLVLALPRGGVPVGFEVAQILQGDLDVFLVRKLGMPGQEELAIGAIASGGVRVLNHDLIDQARLPQRIVDAITAREQDELIRRERLFRQDRPALPAAGRTVILVDDGLATGATMRAAVTALRTRHPMRLIVAVPVAARRTCEEFTAYADEIVCAATPEPFYAVGGWYEDFRQTTDEEVCDLLARSTGLIQSRMH